MPGDLVIIMTFQYTEVPDGAAAPAPVVVSVDGATRSLLHKHTAYTERAAGRPTPPTLSEDPFRSERHMHRVCSMQNLIGTWRLVEWTFTVDDSRPTRPWGGNPAGLLTYTEEAHVGIVDEQRAAGSNNSDAERRTNRNPSGRSRRVPQLCGLLLDGRQRRTPPHRTQLDAKLGRYNERRLIEWSPSDDGVDLILSTPPTKTDGGRLAVNRLRWERMPTNPPMSDS